MFEPKTQTDILQRIANRVVARTELTDLEEGGNVHTLAAGAAREFDDCYFQMTRLQLVWDLDTAAGEDLDERGKDLNPDQITRRGLAKAAGSVVFGRAGTSGTVTIPAGTIVKVADGGPQFATAAAGSILDTFSSSASVAILAVVGGVAGNVDAGAITQMAGVSGVETVTNPAATTGGLEKETDAIYRARMKAYLRSLPRGTPDALRFAALTADLSDTGFGRVTSCTVIELENSDLGKVEVFIDDGAGTVEHSDSTGGTPEVVVAVATGGEQRLSVLNKPIAVGSAVTVTLNGAPLVQGTDYTLNRPRGQITLDETLYPTGLTPGDLVEVEYAWWTGLIAEVQKIIDGSPADRVNYPGYRAAGTKVAVLPPSVLQQVVTGAVIVEDGFDAATVRAAVSAAINRYINSLPINGDVILSELIHQAQSVPGVFDVSFSSPAANVVIGDDELARVIAANIDLL